MRLTIVAPLLLLVATNGWATGLEGDWKGSWIKDGDALQVTVIFEKSDSGYSGSFDSDSLQVAGIPFGDVSDTNGKVHFLLRGDQSTTVFDGTLTGDAISGTFMDGSAKGSFELTRATLPAAGISTREITFQDSDVTLAGTLLLPKAPGRHAAILFLHGSGPEGRWANHYLAQKFVEAGIAALIYDKRGVGQSTGDWKKAGFDALADDAVAGIRFLQSQPEVDSTRVGIYGHSQGGTLVPLIATKAGNLDFVIAAAGGGVAPADVETYSVGNLLGLSRLAPAERADAQSYLNALIDAAYRGKSRALVDASAARFKARAWYFDPPTPDNFYWAFSREIAGFIPSNYWRQVRVPVLLLYGTLDERVPAVPSSEAIQDALQKGGNTRVSLKMFANADHTFTMVDPLNKTGWPRHVPGYADILTSWVQSLK